MNVWQKIFVGTFCSIVWMGGIVLKHFYPTLSAEFGEIIFAAQSVLTSLGVVHLVQNQPKE